MRIDQNRSHNPARAAMLSEIPVCKAQHAAPRGIMKSVLDHPGSSTHSGADFVALQRSTIMSIAKVTEIIAESKDSFDDAVREGIKRATKTLEGVSSAWVQDQTVKVEKGKITKYRVHLKVTFVLKS
jgi:flavin-binding protein dodecin